MQSDKHQFSTKRTARYYQLGELSSKTKHIWLVLHGYGMLAEFFIQKFSRLVTEDTVVIAPEGMQRFYLQGTSGRVGASWMTKDDRLIDIGDNIHFLNDLVSHVWEQVNGEACQLTLLGFSQGCPTAARYAMQADQLPTRFIAYASDIPMDTLQDEYKSRWSQMEVSVVIGNDDPFISDERIAQHREQLKEAGLNYQWVPYQGDHRIFPEVLTQHFQHEPQR